MVLHRLLFQLAFCEVPPARGTRGRFGSRRRGEGLHFCVLVPGSVSPVVIDSGLISQLLLVRSEPPPHAPEEGLTISHGPLGGGVPVDKLAHPLGHVL